MMLRGVSRAELAELISRGEVSRRAAKNKYEFIIPGKYVNEMHETCILQSRFVYFVTRL